MDISKIRATVDFYKSKTVLLKLTSGQILAVGIHDTDEDNAICIPKEILQDSFDGKRTLAEILADPKSYIYIPLLDIVSISE